MEAWSTSRPWWPLQGDLFTETELRRPSRRVVRCWLAMDRGGDDVGVAIALSEHRHFIAVASTGRSHVGDEDLVLFPDWGRERLICLGPSWLAPLLPQQFRTRGLAHWASLLREPGLSVFRPPAQPNACVAVRIRPGRPTGWKNLEGGLLDELERGVRGAAGSAEKRDIEGCHPLAGMVDFEVGRRLAEHAAASEVRLDLARTHMRRAWRAFVAEGQVAWADAAERCLASVNKQLFLLRQLEMPMPLPEARHSRRSLPGLGAGIHHLSILSLPPLALDVAPSSQPAVAPGGREALCVVPFHRPTARRLMPGVGSGMLKGSISFQAPDEPREGASMGTQRLPKGSSVTVKALLDDEHHHLLGLASRSKGADTVMVFADGNGVVVTPTVKRGRIGHPLTFTATARVNGRHSLRFTFLTRDRIVSKIQEMVEVFERGERDGGATERSSQAGQDRVGPVPASDRNLDD